MVQWLRRLLGSKYKVAAKTELQNVLSASLSRAARGEMDDDSAKRVAIMDWLVKLDKDGTGFTVEQRGSRDQTDTDPRTKSNGNNTTIRRWVPEIEPDSASTNMKWTRGRRLGPSPAPAKAVEPQWKEQFQVDPRDRRHDHIYKGQRQPPVGMRIEHILNFLADEDIDRCMWWESQLAEIKDYLHFVDTARQFDELGPNTKLAINEAKQRIKVHEAFQKHHYDTAEVTVPISVQSVPKPRASLQPLPGIPIKLKDEPHKTLPPRKMLHRVPLPANDTFVDLPKFQEWLDQLVRDENAYWGTQVGVTPARNSFTTENSMYEICIKKGTGGLLRLSAGQMALPDGTVLQEEEEGFAKGRGAMRAGVQSILRYFSAAENKAMHTPWRRVHLPVKAEDKAKELMRHREPVFHPFAIPKERLPGNMETQPYTFWWNKCQRIREDLELATRKTLDQENREKDGAGRLVIPLHVDGPVVNEGQRYGIARSHKLYKVLLVTEKLLRRARAIAPRPFIDDVIALYEGGKAGESLPHRLTLRDDEREQGGDSIRTINDSEHYWLRFLTANSFNRQMASPLYPKTALFQSFAEKLQGLFYDLSDRPLFQSGIHRSPSKMSWRQCTRAAMGR